MSSYEIPAVVRDAATKPTARGLRPHLSTRWISGLTLIALLAIWWAVTASGLIEPLFLPSPSAVLEKAGCWRLAATWIPPSGSTWPPALNALAWDCCSRC